MRVECARCGRRPPVWFFVGQGTSTTTVEITLLHASKRCRDQSRCPKKRRVDDLVVPVFPDRSGISCDQIRQAEIANRASARTISTLALLGYCKNSARLDLRAMSTTGMTLPR